ncbi:MAG: hypothetical protein H7Y20_02270 [Bryobacteraceae bacterium]|nr:hypothetical protein [Bryobacteraceae bacterium]
MLSTSVSHDSLLASTSLPDEKKAEIQKLRQAAGKANLERNYGEALRHLHHGIALIRGVEWTPAASLAASFSLGTDHAIWEPGQRIQLRMKRMYQPEVGAPESLSGEVIVRANDKSEAAKLGSWKISGDQPEFAVTAPDLPAGTYRVEVSILPVKSIAVAIQPGLRARAEKLDAQILKLKTPPGTGLWTAQYATELFRRADRSEVSVASFDLPLEIARGEKLAIVLESGADPLANARGDMRLAYRSDVDNTLQPYRLFIPSMYDGTKPIPLVVALHGMGGDENTLFDRYGDGAFIKIAEKHGYMMVAPKGREPASMYRGPAEQDIFDVLARVRLDRRVDELKIFMTGHSMGGFGTWSAAFRHPEIFAAIAPIAGGGDPRGMERLKQIPQIVVHGDNDKTVNVSMSRRMVEAGKTAGVTIEYVEVPGGGHNDVVVPALPRIFGFFEQHPKKPLAAVTAQ